MGLTAAVFGMYGGIVAVSVPQLLAARHVPVATIAGISAVVISPGFWTFLVSPVLDVRFSRRSYATCSAMAASVLLVLALLSLDHPLLFETLLTAGFFFANLYQSALGGWLASIVRAEDEHRLSVWVNIATIGAGGAMALAAGELTRTLPVGTAALMLGAAVLAPITVFPWMRSAPAQIQPAQGAIFVRFVRDLAGLLRRREVLIAMLLFVTPAATFSLTNFISGVGHDFNASTRFVGLVGGGGVLLAGVCGCFAFPLIGRLLPLRLLYLCIGAVGALFTLGLAAAPHTPAAFAIAVLGQNVFQALAFTASTAISFETIGRSNPIAATAWCLMLSSYNVPLSYMLLVDGAGYRWGGVAGSFLADGGVSLAASLLLAGYLLMTASRAGIAGASAGRSLTGERAAS